MVQASFLRPSRPSRCAPAISHRRPYSAAAACWRSDAATFNHSFFEKACNDSGPLQAWFDVIAQEFLLVSPKSTTYVRQVRIDLLHTRGDDRIGFVERLDQLIRQRCLGA